MKRVICYEIIFTTNLAMSILLYYFAMGHSTYVKLAVGRWNIFFLCCGILKGCLAGLLRRGSSEGALWLVQNVSGSFVFL